MPFAVWSSVFAVHLDSDHIPIPCTGVMESIGIVFIRIHEDMPFRRIGIIGDSRIMIDHVDGLRQDVTVCAERKVFGKMEVDQHELIIQNNQRTVIDGDGVIAPVINLHAIPVMQVDLAADGVFALREKRGKLG